MLNANITLSLIFLLLLFPVFFFFHGTYISFNIACVMLSSNYLASFVMESFFLLRYQVNNQR